MTDQELAAIRERVETRRKPYGSYFMELNAGDYRADACALLAEVDRLRTIETAAREWADATEAGMESLGGEDAVEAWNHRVQAAEDALLAAVRGDSRDTGSGSTTARGRVSERGHRERR